MSFEFPPLLADWASDATYGINALLPTIPRDVGDAQPPNVTVVDEIRTAWVARKQITPEKLADGPVVGVFQSGEATYPFGRASARTAGASGARLLEGTASFLFLYMQRNSDSAEAASNARYTLRAILQSLLLLHDANTAQARRVRNGAWLVLPTQFQMSTLLEERGEVLATGGVLATYQTREIIQYIKKT